MFDHALREGGWCNLRRRSGRAELALNDDVGLQPGQGRGISARSALSPFTGVGTVGIEAPVSPGISEVVGKLLMKLEASPSQRRQRRAIAPVQCQKSAGLPRGATSDLVPFDQRDLGAVKAQIIGEAGADDAAAANGYTHGHGQLRASDDGNPRAPVHSEDTNVGA